MLQILLIILLLSATSAPVLAKEIKGEGWTYNGAIDRRGNASGKGVMKYTDGRVYSGYWKKGRPHGVGKYSQADGSYREGDWVESKFTGKGTNVTSLGKRTVGEWNNGLLNGEGSVFLVNNDKYDGNWDNGISFGAARYTFQNGDVYIGPMEGDIPSGNGVLEKADRDLYKGGIRNGNPNGSGEYFDFLTKARFRGIFKAGEKSGEGTLMLSNGMKFKGSWISDEPVGPGIYIQPNGVTHGGVFLKSKSGTWSPRFELAANELAPNNKHVQSSCKKWAFDLIISADSYSNELDFSRHSNVSRCVQSKHSSKR